MSNSVSPSLHPMGALANQKPLEKTKKLYTLNGTLNTSVVKPKNRMASAPVSTGSTSGFRSPISVSTAGDAFAGFLKMFRGGKSRRMRRKSLKRKSLKRKTRSRR